MTGLASILSNYPKAEKDWAKLPDSSSSDLMLTEEWLLTTLFPFLLLQHSLSSLSSVSHNSAGLVVFLSLGVLLVLLVVSLGGVVDPPPDYQAEYPRQYPE